jgi:hypothetical protein
MAYQEVLAADNLNEGRTKINENFVELYAITTVSVTGATSLTSSALGKIHICTGTSADYTVDLPTAVGNEGCIIIKGAAALTKIVTIQGTGGQTIDGESDRKIAATGMISVLSDGSNWVVIQEVGSWISYTPVLGGWSADPTIDRSVYFRVGKMVTVQIHTSANGTSNATTKTFTVPFNAAGPTQIGVMSFHVNAGTTATSPGICITRVAANTVDMYTNTAAAAWTNSGNCRFNVTLNYVMA